MVDMNDVATGVGQPLSEIILESLDDTVTSGKLDFQKSRDH